MTARRRHGSIARMNDLRQAYLQAVKALRAKIRYGLDTSADLRVLAALQARLLAQGLSLEFPVEL